MATPVKLSTCNFHSLHRGTLACRLRIQQPACHQHHINHQTKACHTNNTIKMQPRSIMSMTRNYSNISRDRLCECNARVKSIGNPSASSRLLSTLTGKRCITTYSRKSLFGRLPCSNATNISNVKIPARCLSSSTNRLCVLNEETNPKVIAALNKKGSRYVVDPVLASLMVDKIWHGQNVADDRLIIDISPGIGLLTEEVLNRGAKKVVAIEKKRAFLPGLEKMAKESDGRLRLLQGNYFSLNPRKSEGSSSKKFNTFEDVFEGLEPLPWKSDNPKFSANIIGVVPKWQERGHAFSLAACLLKRSKAFLYGRVQHSLVMSESTYKAIVQEPSGNLVYYGNISALFQLCYNVKLLHVEPITSFKTNFKATKYEKFENLYLVQMTPKLDVFDDGLSEEALYLFVFFLGQMLMRRTALLTEKLEPWVPGHTNIISDFNFNEKTRTGDMSGTDFLNLFKAIRNLDTFSDFMGMHVCNISPQQVDGFRDYMEQQSSESSDMESSGVEDEGFFDYDSKDVAFNY